MRHFNLFGEKNFVSTLPRVTKKGGKDHSGDVAHNHDFLLVYLVSKDSYELKGIVSEEKGFDHTDEFVLKRGKYKLNQTLDYDSLWYNPAMDFPLNVDGEIYYPGGNVEAHNQRHSGNHTPKDWVWRWSQAKFDFGYANGFIEVKKGRDRKRIYTKTYIGASIEKNENGYFIEYNERETKLSSLALTENNFSNDNAKKEIATFIGGNSFDFPKPTSLISQLIKICPSDTLILDFFAGSGTTLHATMQLNAEDGGKRQCILVTNNENNICEEVTYERNKRVINGYTTPKGEQVEGLKNNNLRYYKMEFVDRERTPRNMRQLVSAATDLLCIKENLYDEKSEFGALKLKPQIARYFAKGSKQMLVIYREETIERFVEEIEKMEVAEKIKIYLFSPGRYAFDDEFFRVQDKVTLCALPAAIYDAYQLVLPEKPARLLDEEEENPKPVVQGTLFDEKEEEA